MRLLETLTHHGDVGCEAVLLVGCKSALEMTR